MKRTDIPAFPEESCGTKPNLWKRFLHWKSTLSVRNRIFFHFLLFTILLLVLLWLVEIVFLGQFYRLQKTEMIKSTSEILCRNIDNENIQSLADRYAEQNNICVLIVDEEGHISLSAEASGGCIIHHMTPRDLKHYMRNAGDEITLEIVPMIGFRNMQYDAGKFKGPVPSSDDGSAKSMITVQKVLTEDGTALYVFLNALITPITDTVQTICNELLFITVVLIVLSFFISLILSRHITRPLIQTTEAAASLSYGEYTPVKNPGYMEIIQLNHQLNQAACDLHRVEEMQKELIANISHDLRTPLTLIEGYAEVMRDLPDENTPENMQVIIDETKRLSTLVNAVLELNNSRQAGNNLNRSVFSLTDCVQGIMQRYEKLIQQDGYHVVFRPEEQVFVNADEVRLQQVIYNLINNAITYTGEDRTVNVVQKVADNVLRFEVTDSGEGISPEDLPYVWDRYYRGNKPHKRPTIGSGLGLNIVKNILDAHDLRYGVESTIGRGSTFWFEISVENLKPLNNEPEEGETPLLKPMESVSGEK